MIYENITTVKGKEIYEQVYYPNINENDNESYYYIITKITDRLDLISYDFYNTIDYWKIISYINNLEGDSLYPPVGIQLKLPKNIQNYLDKLNKL
jgi:hypothetical protein